MAAEKQTLGRGDIFFAPKNTDGTLGGYRLIGNTPAFGLTISATTLKHFSSARGVKTQDREVAVQTDYAGQFTTDNITHKNLAALFQGSTSTLSQTSVTGKVTTLTSVQPGLLYQLGEDINPSGVRKISAVVAAVGGSTKVLGTDYTLDTERGTITIVEGGAIAANATLTVTYNVAAYSRDQTVSAANAVAGALRFFAYNPEGDNIDYLMRDVKLVPNGEFAIKAEEWQALPFTIAISAPADGHAVLADGQPF